MCDGYIYVCVGGQVRTPDPPHLPATQPRTPTSMHDIYISTWQASACGCRCTDIRPRRGVERRHPLIRQLTDPWAGSPVARRRADPLTRRGSRFPGHGTPGDPPGAWVTGASLAPGGWKRTKRRGLGRWAVEAAENDQVPSRRGKGANVGGPLCMGRPTSWAEPHTKSLPPSDFRTRERLHARRCPKRGRWIYVKARGNQPDDESPTASRPRADASFPCLTGSHSVPGGVGSASTAALQGRGQPPTPAVPSRAAGRPACSSQTL